ncbi:cobalt ECF transporter T component CbiQ [Myxococcota bacterium]|nr:cobalt ECF transporter T component CbiQ [Myxococcota bacterium]MBU1534120.1 cobalt ECF transporter T component CbiQ [Myxococcota bacterium]
MITPRDPRSKIIIFLGALLLTLSIPADQPRLFWVPALFLLAMAITTKFPPRRLLAPLLLSVPILAGTCLVLIFTKGGGDTIHIGSLAMSETALTVARNLTVRTALSLFCVALLLHTTPLHQLLGGLSWFRIPGLFLELLSFTVRYMAMIGNELAKMRRAAASRGYGSRWFWQARVLGFMAGSLFIRAHGRGECIHRAMISRGYTSQSLHAPQESMKPADFLLMGGAISLFALTLLSGLWP